MKKEVEDETDQEEAATRTRSRDRGDVAYAGRADDGYRHTGTEGSALHDGPGEAVTGGFTLLQRWSNGAAAEVRTSVQPGHVVTLWWVAFNNPGACSAPGCGADDVFTFDADGNVTGFNVPQIQAADISVFGGGGDVSNPAGRLKITSDVEEGDVPGPGQLVIGRDDDGALVGVSDVSGLTDAEGAEIHFVLQDHGPAHHDPELLRQQLTQFHGACNDVCRDIQFSVHKP